jgi:protein-S-isoprenylcysteine O-methyltransferase Ste14
MPLREQFEKHGNWLFQRRSFLPLLGMPLLVLLFHRFSYPWKSHALDLMWEMLCLAVSIMGLTVRAYTTGCIPKRTSGRNTWKGQIADSLNRTGIYSLVRHPLYLGNFLMGLGPAMFFRLWWFVLLYVLAFWLYYERIMFAEEEFLRKKFGDVYLAWAARTPVFVPNFKNWRRSNLPFSLPTVLKREYQSLFLLIAFFTVLEIIGDTVAERRFVIDPVWLGLFGGVLMFSIVIRVLRKRTRSLHVQGR